MTKKLATSVVEYPNGASVFFARTASSDAPYITYARAANGEIIDKMRCDDYRTAREYFRAFKLLAKNS